MGTHTPAKTESEEAAPRKQYSAPRLIVHGTVVELTKTGAGALSDGTGLGSR